MLGRLALITALVAGVAPSTAAWAQNDCYPLLPPQARVVYLDNAPRPGGFWRCRLTPRYQWLCDGWSGPGYVFYGNVVTCY
jgi:hypothetical protein